MNEEMMEYWKPCEKCGELIFIGQYGCRFNEKFCDVCKTKMLLEETK